MLGLPDAVVIPETAEFPTIAIEKIDKSRKLPVAQNLSQRYVTVISEEIVICLLHRRYLLSSWWHSLATVWRRM